MKHISVASILTTITPALPSKGSIALRRAGHTKRLATFALIFTICAAMLSWFGFLFWGVYSAVRWFWQLI
jgi:hypothetical protein